jgi:hypothetical protein
LRDSGSIARPARTASRGERRRAVEQDLPRVPGVGAEDAARELRAPGPDQPGDAEDLAGVDVERDVVEDAGAPQAADGQGNPRVATDRGPLRELHVEASAQHGGDEGLGRLLADRRCSHVAPVLQDRDTVSQREHVAEEVRDVDDRRPTVA